MADAREHGEIACFLSIDVEPDQRDGEVGPRGPVTWSGVAWTRGRLDDVRTRLERASGSELRVGWYLRMDPQIGALCGRADHLAQRFGDDAVGAWGSGAYAGLHVHATRWHDERQAWVGETHLPDVCAEHLAAGIDAYTTSMGGAPQRHRFTINVSSRAMRAALAAGGVRVDVRPAEAPPHRWFDRRVRAPYRSSAGGAGASGGTWVVPATASTWSQRYGGSPARRAARRLARGPFVGLPVDPYRPRPTPTEFWDEVALVVADLPRPYASIALRTAPEGSWPDARNAELLDALTDHPIARRLRFRDPLGWVASQA